MTAATLSTMQLTNLNGNALADNVSPRVIQFMRSINDGFIPEVINRHTKDGLYTLMDSMNTHSEKERVTALAKQVFSADFQLVSNYQTTAKLAETAIYNAVSYAFNHHFLNDGGTLNYKGKGGYEKLIQKAIEDICTREGAEEAARAAA